MTTFTQYLDALTHLALGTFCPAENHPPSATIHAALDGGPSAALARSYPLPIRRALGAFFTGPDHARRMVRHWPPTTPQNYLYVDPACGSGDLLLAAARNLPVLNSLAATLHSWGDLLAGFDVEPSFVAATKARLTLLARTRVSNGWCTSPPPLSSTFPHILLADALTTPLPQSSRPLRLLMNPPFVSTPAPSRCSWASGSVSTAAVFTHRCLHQLPPHSELVALLPDVLRSGTRYSRWRRIIASNAEILDIQPLCRFSPAVDVDVFLLALRATPHPPPSSPWPTATPAAPSVLDHSFHVRVGSVVPHRHPETGPLCPYVTTRDLPIGAEITDIPSRRQFSGTLFPGPFVAVRRTSRPGERRCRATLVATQAHIAVENHLLVLTPRDGTLHSCRQAITHLNSSATDRWLDQRIRCRHLTVSAVQAIPFP